MKAFLRYSALTILVLTCIGVAYCVNAYRFYAQELRDWNIVETVRIDDALYTVDRGEVSSNTTNVSGITALRALRTTYGKTLAVRSPILGLEGTDPAALRTNTSRLERTIDELAALQNTENDAKLIQDALYPIDFLYALASLESARKKFIVSGSERDLNIYLRLYNPVIDTGLRDAQRLIDASAQKAQSGHSPRTVSFSGTITSTSRELSLASVPDSFARTKEKAARLSRCLLGATWMCPKLSLPSLSELHASSPFQEKSGAPVALDTHIRAIMRSAAATTSYDRMYAPVRLAESACLASLPSPYNMEASILLRTNFNLLRYVDDMYFVPTVDSKLPMPQFFRDQYGLRYLTLNPLTFYLCPHLIEDVSAVQATLQAAAIAKKYGMVPNSHRDALISGSPDSEEAIAYTREATGLIERTSTSEEYSREVLSVSLIFAQKSAGLDAIVGQINYIITHDIALAINGAPFDLSARTLFLTHTAAPSLFLFHQIGAQSLASTTTEKEWSDFRDKIESYSSLRKSLNDATFIAEIQGMEHAEQSGL